MVVGASEKQSIREAIEHLLARKREMRPLFLVPARPMKVLCRYTWRQYWLGEKEEGRTHVVDKSVLGSVALGLERAEEGLLGTEDLNGRGGVLGQVGEGSSVADEASSDRVADEGGEVGRDETHLLAEVKLEALAVGEEVDDAGGKVGNVEVVDGGDVGSHRGACGVEDIARERVVVLEDLGKAVERLLRKRRLVADELDHARVLVVVGDEADEFGEVPAVPLAHAHRERVDVLVELVEECDRLDDHVVRAVHVELHLGARVGVSKSDRKSVV